MLVYNSARMRCNLDSKEGRQKHIQAVLLKYTFLKEIS